MGRKKERLAVRQASFSGMDFQENPSYKNQEVTKSINHNQIYIVCGVCAEIAMCGFHKNPSFRS
jgi:hypothetical protein